MEWINEAIQAGARRAQACAEAGLTLRTLQRWTEGDEVKVDARTTTTRPVPINKLSEAEQCAVLAACNRADHAHLPPSQIVPKLADEGVYLASESTFYRVLKDHDQGHRRGRAAIRR